MDYGISSATGTSSVFNAPGLRPVDPSTQQGQPAQAGQAQRQDQEQQAVATRQTLNTAPTEQQRDEAVASGQTRGSFVDIRA